MDGKMILSTALVRLIAIPIGILSALVVNIIVSSTFPALIQKEISRHARTQTNTKFIILCVCVCCQDRFLSHASMQRAS